MRDLVLAAFVFGSIPFILARPQLGVAMYLWLSVMNPHRLTWGFAHEMSFASIVAAATLLALPFSKDVRWPRAAPVIVALVAFLAWTGVTTVYALDPGASYERWETLLKTGLMALLIPMLFHTKEHLRLLIWVLVVSIAYYGVKGGIFTLLTGGEGRVWGPRGSYIEDNNALAVAIVMFIPFMRYLQLTTGRAWVRWMLLGMMVCCAAAVFGTYSRGALLAVAAMSFVFWWKGRHKSAVLAVAALTLIVTLSTMPDRWFERMETIKHYQEEGSASARLNTWATMWNLAKDRPVTGGGFEVALPEVYSRYAPDPSFRPQVAHSIYLQALGEHGFVGLGLYLLLLGSLWWSARNVIKVSSTIERTADVAWARDFALMMQVSLTGFAVGGAFLSLVNFDAPYYLMTIMVATASIVQRQAKAASVRAPGAIPQEKKATAAEPLAQR